MNQKIKLIALDLDGTLYNSEGKISEKNKAAIRHAVNSGIRVIISTGRPFVGLPLPALNELGIEYAITANGAAVYHIPGKELLFENAIDSADGAALLQELYHCQLHLDAFINGDAYTALATRPYIERLHVPESLRTYIRDTRTVVDNLPDFILQNKMNIQKLTLNFLPDEHGGLLNRDKVLTLLSDYENLHFVSGGFRNIEVNKKGISKAKGLRFLCNRFQLSIDATMACGDSENDFDIVSAAGIGVAMANAEPLLLKNADFISLSNEEHGVAYAIEKLVFS